jgi:ankyrin repeat protein
VLAGDTEALEKAKEFHPHANRALAGFTLADAQLVTARSYGFANWTMLKQHLTDIEPFVWNPPPAPGPESRIDVFIRLSCLTYTALHPSPAKARRMITDDPALPHANIYTAAAVGDTGTVGAMLDRDPALVNRKGGPLHWEPLLYACYSRLEPTGPSQSTLEVARLLLSRGADPNAGFLYEGSYAFTALTGAFGRGEDWTHQPPHSDCEALAQLLLGAGADPNDAQTLYNRHFKDNDDHLKLLFAYGLGQDQHGPWIARLNDPFFNPTGLLAIELGWAVQHNFFERVKLLLGRGVDVNARSRRTGRTPYEEALRAGHREIGDYLLHRGAAKIDLDPLEQFAIACIAGRHDEVHARLAGDPTILDRLGRQGRLDMLHRAVEVGQQDGIRLIVALGVDINGMVPGTAFDRAILHNVAGWGRLDMVRLLIELGADPGLRDLTYHGAPIGWALYNGNQPDVVDYLLQFSTIFDAVQAGSVERVAALLRDAPLRANARDEQGRPVIFYLHPGIARLEDMIEALVAHGADLNAADRNSNTLLKRALACGETEFADMLTRHGARA